MGISAPYKDTYFKHSFLHSTTQMSKQVMIDLLDRANNGSDLMKILDTLTSDNVSGGYDNEPTADVVEFW